MKEVRVGIIGTGKALGNGQFGGIARLHLNGYRTCPGARLTGFYDAVPANARGWAKFHGVEDVPVYEDLDEFLRHVDAVSICTPNSTHRELALKCLRAGVAVLCEKPMTATLAEAREMAAEAARTGGIHMMGFSYRRVPAVLYTRELIQSGQLGELFWARMEFSGDRTAGEDIELEWRFQRRLQGHGALADFGSHCIDITRFILGEEAARVEAVTGSTRTCITHRRGPDGQPQPVDNDDVAAWVADLACGATVSYHVSRIGYGGFIIAEFAGSGGAIRWDGMRPDRVELRLKEHRGPYREPWQEVPVPERFLPQRPVFLQNPVELQIEEFVQAVREGRPAAPDFRAGLEVQQIIEAAARSAGTGQRVNPADL